MSTAVRRQRTVVRRVLVDLAAAGPDPAELERAAALAVVSLAQAGDADGLAEILRPDPLSGPVIWTVACYQIGDLTPTALRDMADPLQAVNLVVDCPEASHIAAELVASTADGLRWTALVRAGEVVRFSLPGVHNGDATTEEQTRLGQGARDRWNDLLASWSAEVGSTSFDPTDPLPTYPAPVVAGTAWPQTDAAPRPGFASVAVAAAAALAEGAGIDFDPESFFVSDRTARAVPGAGVPVVASSDDGEPRIAAMAARHSAELEAAATRHSAELDAAAMRHAAELDATTTRCSAELDAVATRHAAELQAAFRQGHADAMDQVRPVTALGPYAIEDTMARLSAVLDRAEQRLLEVEAAVRRVESLYAAPPITLPPLVRRLAATLAAAAASEHHPRVARLVTVTRRWMQPDGPTTPSATVNPHISARWPIDTNCTPA